MTGILKIDLPDDFKKGQCDKCPISYRVVTPGGYTDYCILNNVANCPLEIPKIEPPIKAFTL